mgnify:CR=1 FL=1|tara:strand:- start:159 stop:338 length:180 start_codon:yes stop_codon:yes gene_type:complete
MTLQEKNIILQDLRKKLTKLKREVRDTEEEIIRTNRAYKEERLVEIMFGSSYESEIDYE